MHQHAEAVHGARATPSRRPEQGGLERVVDDIGYCGIAWQLFQRYIERCLAGHTEAGGVDKQLYTAKALPPIAPLHRPDIRGLASNTGKILRAGFGAVHNADFGCAAA